MMHDFGGITLGVGIDKEFFRGVLISKEGSV